MVPEHCDERALAAEARQVADLGPKGFATQGKEANILLYNTVLVLPYIDIILPRVYMSSQS